MEPYLVLSREIHGLLGSALASDGLDQKSRASDEELIIEREAILITREHDEVRAHDGETRHARLTEGGIPYREHTVAKAQHIAHDALVRFVEQIWLAALCVDVCVRPEEGRKHAYAVPTHEHLRLRVAEEASYVRYKDRSEFGVEEIRTDYAQPAKLKPAILLASTILTPTAM